MELLFCIRVNGLRVMDRIAITLISFALGQNFEMCSCLVQDFTLVSMWLQLLNLRPAYTLLSWVDNSWCVLCWWWVSLCYFTMNGWCSTQCPCSINGCFVPQNISRLPAKIWRKKHTYLALIKRPCLYKQSLTPLTWRFWDASNAPNRYWPFFYSLKTREFTRWGVIEDIFKLSCKWG